MVHIYHLGAVKPWVQTAADDIGNRFDISVIGGWRAVGSVANSDHPKGLAIDAMTLNKAKGEAIAEYAITNRERLGVAYVIHWRRIWTAARGWHDYTGPNPHIDHVHISFEESGGDGTSGTGDDSDNGGLLDPSSWPIIGEIEDISTTLRSLDTWKRVGFYVAGMCLIAIGFFLLFRRPIQAAAQTAATVASKGVV